VNDQHRESVPAVQEHRRVESGPITLAPDPSDFFIDVATSAGAQLVKLGPETRGLIWLSEKRAEDLQAALDAHPRIEWVQLPWAGVDAFSSLLTQLSLFPDATRPVVTSAKGAYSEPVAEHALALLLACMRELPRKARESQWQAERSGLSLFGRRIVVLGAGGVARTFIDLVAPFRPHITVVRRGRGDVPGAENTVGPDRLDDVLASADAVVVAAAATPGTRHIIGAAQLAIVPDHAVLVNVARGSLVDADAVFDALESGSLFGAGLDVMDPEPYPSSHRLWSNHRAVITSHSADTPEMTRPLLAARIRANVHAFGRGAPFTGVVDLEAGY
jgi:phosphoglycerate dehydrogenase-like enzyme